MLSPELLDLYTALERLKDHPNRASLLIADEFGHRFAMEKTFVVGSRTTDPGLVIRITDDPDPT